MPKAADYLGEAHFELTVLPARVAYLIKLRSRVGMARAIEEACTRWAGATEPIIAVPGRGQISDLDREVLATSQVVALVNVDAPEKAARVLADGFNLPLVPLDHIDFVDPSRWTCHPTCVTAGARQEVTLPSSEALWEAVAVGSVVDERQADLVRANVGMFLPPADAYLGTAQVTRSTLVDLSLWQFGELYIRGDVLSHAVIAVVRRNDVEGCRRFWNFRATRPVSFGYAPMLLLPDRGVEHWVDFDQTLAGLLGRRVDHKPDALVMQTDVPLAKVDAIMKQLGLQAYKGKQVTRRSLRIGGEPPAMRSAPFSYAVVSDLDWAFLGPREYGVRTDTRAPIFRQSSRVDFASPVRFTLNGYTLVRVKGEALKPYPTRPEVAKLLNPETVWRGESLEFGRAARNRLQAYMNLPELSAVLETILDKQQVRFGRSDKGALAAALAGRVSPIELAEAGVMAVIKALTFKRTNELARLIDDERSIGKDGEQIAKALERLGGLSRRFRSVNDLRSELGQVKVESLEKLAAHGWLERGLRVDCELCRSPSFVPLRDATAVGTCPACGHAQGYRLGRAGPEIVYRLDAVVDRASDQGVLPQAIAVATLSAEDPDAYLLPGADLTLSNGNKADADILGIFKRKLVAGEVKTRPTDFTPEEVRKDVKRAKAISADLLVLASLHRFPDGDATALERFVEDDGIAVRVLDGMVR